MFALNEFSNIVGSTIFRFVAEVVRAVLKVYGIKAGPLEPLLDRLAGQVRGTLDERLIKIETARENLIEALDAIDELKLRAEQNRRDLEELNAALARAEQEKHHVSAELVALEGLSALDTETVRKTLGVPTTVDRWTERVISFILGVIASTLATITWEYAIKRLFV